MIEIQHLVSTTQLKTIRSFMDAGYMLEAMPEIWVVLIDADGHKVMVHEDGTATEVTA